jgi:hypothetical protein
MALIFHPLPVIPLTVGFPIKAYHFALMTLIFKLLAVMTFLPFPVVSLLTPLLFIPMVPLFLFVTLAIEALVFLALPLYALVFLTLVILTLFLQSLLVLAFVILAIILLALILSLIILAIILRRGQHRTRTHAALQDNDQGCNGCLFC